MYLIYGAFGIKRIKNIVIDSNNKAKSCKLFLEKQKKIAEFCASLIFFFV